tara:strand:+ start:629 stop:838 length:210 start_codon:yes stop_codon:yes gene_type:complete
MKVFEQLRNEGWYALAMWSTEDVHEAREKRDLPKLSEADAEEWLNTNEDKIKDYMVEHGWEMIDALLTN